MKTVTHCIILLLFVHSLSIAQRQSIQVCGKVWDEDYYAVNNVKISLIFNNYFLAWGYTNEVGDYCLWQDTYGGIDRVDILLEYEGNEISYIEDYLIADGVVNLNFQLAGKNGDFEYVPKKYRPRIAPEDLPPPSPVSYGGVQCSFYRPDLFRPVYYHRNVSYEFEILDNDGEPVKNARVTIIAPDDVPRWGETDENGMLQMHMYYSMGILDGKITVSADGYKHKKLLFQKFNARNSATIKLKKKKRG